MKMLSIMLYNDVAMLAIIAGTEYCKSSLPTGAVPSVKDDCDVLSPIISKSFTKLTQINAIIAVLGINFA
jgi:hypothetical protein